LEHNDIPGLAMSRSFGDQVAASVKCIPDPGNLVFISRNKTFDFFKGRYVLNSSFRWSMGIY